MAKAFKNYTLGIPEHTGQRITNEIGDTFTGIYEFKDKERIPFFRLFETSEERLDYKEVKTIWHSETQARFIREDKKFKHEQHYLAQEGTQRRQADIIYDDRVVIELQHSNISLEELNVRTADALENYDKIIWIFDYDTQMKAKLYQTDKDFNDLGGKIIKPLSYKQKAWIEELGGITSTLVPQNMIEQANSYAQWNGSISYGWNAQTQYLPNSFPNKLIDNSKVRFRHSTPPSWALLVAEQKDSLYKGYNIKQYGMKEQAYLEQVEVWLHYYEPPIEEFDEEIDYFLKFTKGYGRQQAKVYCKDAQRRYPYVVEFLGMEWNELLETIKND